MVDVIELTSDQEHVVNTLVRWYVAENRTPYITLGGYAGTGKTTLIPIVVDAIRATSPEKQLTVALSSYTGKATLNLKAKLDQKSSFTKTLRISTIHGLIYNPLEDSRGAIIGWDQKDAVEVDLIIIDEASMVDGAIWQDLLSYRVPIIAIGDHGQLPPIKGQFNLMQKPDLLLNRIHRQAEGNPIITVATFARESGIIPPRRYSRKVIKFTAEDSDAYEVREDLLSNYTTDTLIVCGYNSTRTKINQYVRGAIGFESENPQVGDRVICLRNNHQKGIYNGMLGTILYLAPDGEDYYEVEIEMDDQRDLYAGKIYAHQFNASQGVNFGKDRLRAAGVDLFDFGYALTVHKAQGSQAKRVVLFEERFPKMNDDEWKRWLYTAVTRAEEELYVFGRN